MKTKRYAAVLLAALVAGALFAPNSAIAKKKKAKAGPLVVGTDAAGDWGASVDANLAPIGDVLGQDLIEAEINMADKETVNFVIKLNSLPANGGVPEITRYVWDMTVDGEFVELDGKWSNYSRGACDPTSGQCPPPRDPGMQPFIVRGNCTIANDTGSTVTTCEEIGIIQAAFDAAAATVTIPVPLEMINAKHGSKIAPGTNIFGGSLSATPAAFLSSTAAPLDTLTITETFVVSSK
jgi:hypothetical protein